MLRPHRAAAGIVLLAALSFGTAACATTPGTTTDPTPTKPATDVLTDAVAKGQGQSFTFDQTYGTTMTSNGARDASGQNWKSSMTLSDAASGLTIKGDVVNVGPDLYLKLDMGPVAAAIPGLAGLGDKWMHMDKSKLGSGNVASGLVSGGKVDAEEFAKGVVSAERVSDTEIKGTLDLTKSASSVVTADELAALGPEAKNVPFTATLDGDGRIAKFVISMPKVGDYPAADLTTTFSNYGSEVAIAKPAAAETVEAPELIYQLTA